ncbi:hypothetical protein [Nocardioides euryhalodurans]|uniref:hypothetical protein n=1 Tax=Nocardioides euryhalodurans TaxID=2518370 RepID=UPI00141F4F3E|nr:hypothetical protein [Nocardioides euryhalodurans]
MPKSRNRRTGRSRKQSSRWSDPDLAPHLTYVRRQLAVNAREQAGDAAGALALMEQQPYDLDGGPYWAWWRVERLLQIASLPDVLPGWAMSRWILAQALAHLDEPGRRITTRAMRLACQVSGQPDVTGGRGREDREAFCRILDHDWAYRQAFLYEYGGLRHFLAGGFAPVLARHADSIEEWVGTPMGAYRLVDVEPRAITWRDLGADREVATLNLGAAAELSPGDCVLGRLVPVEQGRMFECAPLAVDEPVALAVADQPAAWATALQWASAPTIRDGFALLTDVPDPLWRELARQHDGPAGLVLAAMAGRVDDATVRDLWPCVAAAAVAPGAWPLVAGCLDPRHAAALASLGQKLAGPAGELCWRTARVLRESA